MEGRGSREWEVRVRGRRKKGVGSDWVASLIYFSFEVHPWIHVQYSPKENSGDYITRVHRFHHILDFVPRHDFHFTWLFIKILGQ
jgi:hypothetical protein